MQRAILTSSHSETRMMMKPALFWSLPLVLLVGCSDKDSSDDGNDSDVTEVEDRDGDTYIGEDDCDDSNPDIHKGAEEVCDGIDNDCDGVLDPVGYLDGDGDGFGDLDNPVDCATSTIEDSSDCDDTDAWVNPGASERCNTLDDDCDGAVDEALTPQTWALLHPVAKSAESQVTNMSKSTVPDVLKS